ncbi:class I SAM-dependent methyltransferase [Paenibacillus sp. GCM10023252]|uniref:class I SAM-dependent methyltransferase n=1 Tax=Paenibacillus sp. GCM10023252 TaxID=3252649 RepID=UPI00361DAA2E
MNKDYTYNSEKALAYDKITRISVPTYDTLLSMIESYYRAHLGGREASILVVGAGGGNELAAWGPSNSSWTWTGIDPSEEMHKIAQHKAVQLGIEDRVTLTRGTIDDLPLPQSGFDAATCILVLHFVEAEEDKLKLLRSIKEYMKPGAPLVLVTAYGDRESAELQDRINVWKTFFLGAGWEPSRVEEMGRGIMKISFISDSEIERLLAQAGFGNITRFYSTGLFGGWMCKAIT